MSSNGEKNFGFRKDNENDKSASENTTEDEQSEIGNGNHLPQVPQVTMSHVAAEEYIMYKSRWIGMFAIFMLNLSTGLVWLTFNAVTKISETWLKADKSQVNLTVILYFVAYIIMSSFSGYIFEKWGIKKALIVGGVINLVGTWTRYFASFIDQDPKDFNARLTVVLIGQFIAAAGQPFFLNAPPKYAAVWFSESTRTTGTTIGSVSNPFAAAVAMIVIPELCKSPNDMQFTLLIVAIVAAIALIPAIFMPNMPPTPPSSSAAMALAEAADEPFWISIRKISTNRHFWVLFTSFSIYVAFFNAFSSLINQIVEPYGYTDDDAGLFGACLIIAGIIGAGICGAVVDKTKKHALLLKAFTPLVGLAYVAFIFAVRKDFFAWICVVCVFIGFLSFGLLPVALELGVECTYPIPPSASTSLLWMGGQTFAVIFLVVGDKLRDESPSADPPDNMKTALICMGVVSCVTALTSCLYNSPNHRMEAERRQREEEIRSRNV